MIPPTTTGASTPLSRSLLEHFGHELEVAPGQDRQTDHVDILVARRGGDLGGRRADAGVHHFEACISRRHGNLLGPVRMTVETGLSDEEPGRCARARPDGRHAAAASASSAPRWPIPPDTPVGARNSPKICRRVPAHSPVVPPAWARATVAGMTFRPDSAARRRSSSACETGRASRLWRHRRRPRAARLRQPDRL